MSTPGGNPPLVDPRGSPLNPTTSTPPTLVDKYGNPLRPTTPPATTPPATTPPATTPPATTPPATTPPATTPPSTTTSTPPSTTAPSTTAAANAGRFQQLRTLLTTGQLAGQPAKVASGLAWATIAIDALAVLNLGNPWLFLGHSDEWTDTVSLEVGSIWADLNNQYVDHIAGNWTGDAQAALFNYMIRKLQPATDALKALANEFASQMSTLSGSVLTADTTAIGLVLGSVAFLNACLALDMSSLGTFHAGLVLAVLAYIGTLVAWIAGVVTLFQSFQTALVALHGKANDVKNAIWVDARTRKDPGRVALPPDLYDNDHVNDDYWTRNPNLDKQHP